MLSSAEYDVGVATEEMGVVFKAGSVASVLATSLLTTVVLISSKYRTTDYVSER